MASARECPDGSEAVISVFTSSHNHGEFLAAAIESVIAQTFKDFEYLIYDDGSDDDTWSVIAHYAARDSRIRPFKLSKQPNVGVVVNRSVSDAKGSVWVWCPADDLLLPDLLRSKSELANLYPSAVIYSHGRLMDKDGKVCGKVASPPWTPNEFRKVIQDKCPIGLTGLWVPMSVFDRVGGFPEHLPYSEDFYWMLKACREGVDFRCVHQILYCKRKHGNSLTGRHQKEILANISCIREEVRNG